MLSAAILIVLLCSACSERPERPLRIGTNSWPGYEPLYLARDRGFLDDQVVHMVEYPSSSEVIRAIRNSAIDGASLTLDEVLMLAADGLAPRIVLVMDISHGGDAILGQPGIANLASLAGKRVGVESNALGAYVLSRALELIDLTTADIHISSLEVNEHETAFINKQVDAVVTFEPVRSRLLNSGAVSLFDSSQIPGEIVDVLVVREDVAEQRQRSIRHLLESWFRALAFLQADPNAAADSFAVRLKITSPQVLDALQGLHFPSLAENRQLIGGQPAELVQTGKRLMDVMRSHHLLPKDVDTETLFDAGPLNTLQ